MDKKTIPEIRFEPQEQGIVYPFLRIYEEEGPFLKSFKISVKTVVIGRDKGADLKVQDKYLSRKHFQIEFLGEGKLFLQDLGSANGTFLNGKKIDRAKLDDGDEIVVGEKRIVVSYKLPKARKETVKTSFDGDMETVAEYDSNSSKQEKTEAQDDVDWRAIEEREALKEREEKRLIDQVIEKRKDKKKRKLSVVPKEEDQPPVTAPTHHVVKDDEDYSVSKMEKVLELASIKDRRQAVREEAIPEPEFKVKISKVLFFVIILLLIVFASIPLFKFARNYFTGSDGGLPDKIATRDRSENVKKNPDEKPVIPPPDIRPTEASPIPLVQAEKLIKDENEARKDLRGGAKPLKVNGKTERTAKKIDEKTKVQPAKTADRTKSKGQETKEKTHPKAVAVTKENLVVTSKSELNPKKTVVKIKPKEDPISPIQERSRVVGNVVDSLREKEVLAVDLNKASKTLVASRESRDGKEAKTSREIDIEEVRKLLDIDVNLSIMSEEVMLSEKRDVNQFRKTLKERISAVSYCYQEALRRDTSIHGNTRVSFTVGRGGRVSKASVENSNIFDKSLNGCIIKKVKDTVFDDPPHDNFTISYTFKFKKSTFDFSK